MLMRHPTRQYLERTAAVAEALIMTMPETATTTAVTEAIPAGKARTGTLQRRETTYATISDASDRRRTRS